MLGAVQGRQHCMCLDKVFRCARAFFKHGKELGQSRANTHKGNRKRTWICCLTFTTYPHIYIYMYIYIYVPGTFWVYFVPSLQMPPRLYTIRSEDYKSQLKPVYLIVCACFLHYVPCVKYKCTMLMYAIFARPAQAYMKAKELLQ